MTARIRLDDADDAFAGLGPPLLDQRSNRRYRLWDLVDDAGDSDNAVDATESAFQPYLTVIRDELVGTALALRNGAEPRTTLHALILGDHQTVGQIAATLHADPRDIELALVALQAIGWVRVTDPMGPFPEYSLDDSGLRPRGDR